MTVGRAPSLIVPATPRSLTLSSGPTGLSDTMVVRLSSGSKNSVHSLTKGEPFSITFSPMETESE